MIPVKTASVIITAWLTTLGQPTVAIAKTSYVDADGHRIAYEVIGEGEPLLLIPGFSQSREAWKQSGHALALVKSGRQVILIDPRGHGASDKPHDVDAYSFEAVDDDVIAVLDALQIERADLVGYSRGAWIAIAAAIQHPKRVSRVVAGGAHPYAEDMGPFRDAVDGNLEEWVELIESRAGPMPSEARSMFRSNDIEALRAAASRDRLDRSAELSASGVPVTFYAGSEDVRAELARRFVRSTPTAEFIELKGLNHFQTFFALDPVVALVTRGRSEPPSR